MDNFGCLDLAMTHERLPRIFWSTSAGPLPSPYAPSTRHGQTSMQCDQMWRFTRQVALFQFSWRAKFLGGGCPPKSKKVAIFHFCDFYTVKLLKNKTFEKKFRASRKKKYNFLKYFFFLENFHDFFFSIQKC